MPNQDLIDRYFAGMRNRDVDALLALFTEDATFILPDGREFEGREAISEMYRLLFANSRPNPSPRPGIVGTDCIATEVETELPDGSKRYTANFFHFSEDGLLRRVHSYRRG